jgi:tripartite-type tricarboxylate transporter receptor subunit TctC
MGRLVSFICGLVLVLSAVASAAAQAYPERAVVIVVPFPPGAGADVVTRLIANKMSARLGKPFVIENKAGAAGNLGAEYVARATADGYTLLAAPSSIAASETLYKHLPFSLDRDFTPVAMMASVPFLLVANPSVPANNVKELIELAKAHPNKITFASTGFGSSPHLTMEMFMRDAHVSMLHVPYKGSNPAVIDLLSGQVNVMFGNMLSVLPSVKAGKLKALAVSSTHPSPAIPDVPTVASQALPDFESATWFALVAPARTPSAILDRLNGEMNEIVRMPDVQQALLLQGAEAGKGSRAEVGAYIRSEVARWGEIVKASGLTIK